MGKKKKGLTFEKKAKLVIDAVTALAALISALAAFLKK